LPSDLINLLDAERKKRTRRRYLPLWGGAVAVGLAIGILPSVWPDTAGKTAEPQPEVAPQTVPNEIPSAEDEAWAERGGEVETPHLRASASALGFAILAAA